MKTFEQSVRDMAALFAARGIDPKLFGVDTEYLLNHQSGFKQIKFNEGWVHEFANMEDHVRAEEGVIVLKDATVRMGATLKKNCLIGAETNTGYGFIADEGVIIGKTNTFVAGTRLGPGTVIGNDNVFCQGFTTEQNVRVGSHCVVAPHVAIGKGEEIPNDCVMGDVDRYLFATVTREGRVMLMRTAQLMEHPRKRLPNAGQAAPSQPGDLEDLSRRRFGK